MNQYQSYGTKIKNGRTTFFCQVYVNNDSYRIFNIEGKTIWLFNNRTIQKEEFELDVPYSDKLIEEFSHFVEKNVDLKSAYNGNVEFTISYSKNHNSNEFNDLGFESIDGSGSSISRWYLLNKLETDSIENAFRILSKSILEKPKPQKILTNDMTIFEEFLEIKEQGICYMGFRDKSPFESHQELFRLDTIEFLDLINVIQSFIKRNKVK